MNKTFCDICGKEIKPNEDWSHYKLKKYEASWQEGWWAKLDVHDACWKDLCKAIEEKRNEISNK